LKEAGALKNPQLKLEAIVLFMRADPEPNEAISALFGERSIAKANPCRPKLSTFLRRIEE
jgi:hypothetical protein